MWNKHVRQLTEIFLIVTLLLFAGMFTQMNWVLPKPPVAAAGSSMATIQYRGDCFDLESGTVLDFDGPHRKDCYGEDWDFTFSYGSEKPTHTVLFQNWTSGVKIAYSEKSYDEVDFSTIENLKFVNTLIDISLTHIAVIQTPEGNFFKVQLLREKPDIVTFQWQGLKIQLHE